ncbi:MAG: zinc ribbon domain-containing protein, partial [Pirellulaceae bacterium]
GSAKTRYAYYKCKRSRVSGTCENYAVRTEQIEAAVLEHFREVWLSPAGQQALRKAIKKVSRERERAQPNRVKELETQLATLERQISRGTENLLLVDAGDIPGLKQILAGWRNERDAVQAALAAERTGDTGPPELDEDAVLAELGHLEEDLASDCVPLAKAACGRVFKTITLFWKRVSPRYRELERAEIEARFPFA